MAGGILSGDGIVKKDLATIIGLFILVVGLMVFSSNYFSSNLFGFPQGATPSATSLKKTTPLTVKTLSIVATISRTLEERRAGLGGRESLEINRGMLFVFDTSDNWAIWMKGMKFPIDIIWIGEDKKIVSIAQNVVMQPGKKDSELATYKPSGPARYVLEINAGLANANGLTVGDMVNFSL